MNMCTGFWICALDSDDFIGKNYFEEAEKAMTADPNLNLIYSNQQFFGESQWLWDVYTFIYVYIHLLCKFKNVDLSSGFHPY
jgi:hypothetical protein